MDVDWTFGLFTSHSSFSSSSSSSSSSVARCSSAVFSTVAARAAGTHQASSSGIDSARSATSLPSTHHEYDVRAAALSRWDGQQPADPFAIMRLIQEMQLHAMPVPARMYNYAITAMLECAKTSKEHEEARIDTSDVQSASSGPRLLSSQEYLDYLQQLIEEMRGATNGLQSGRRKQLVPKPDASTYVLLVRALEFAWKTTSDARGAVSTADHSSSSGSETFHLRSLLTVYDDMLRTLRQPSTSVLNTFLRSFVRLTAAQPSGMEIAQQIVDNMLALGEIDFGGNWKRAKTENTDRTAIRWPSVAPDNLTFRILIEAYCRAGALESALAFYRLWKTVGAKERERLQLALHRNGQPMPLPAQILQPQGDIIELLMTNIFKDYARKKDDEQKAEAKGDESEATEADLSPPSSSSRPSSPSSSPSSDSPLSSFLPSLPALFNDLLQFGLPVRLTPCLLTLKSLILLEQHTEVGMLVDLMLQADGPAKEAFNEATEPIITEKTNEGQRRRALQRAQFREEILKYYLERNDAEQFWHLHSQFKPRAAEIAIAAPSPEDDNSTSPVSRTAAAAAYRHWSVTNYLHFLDAAPSPILFLYVLHAMPRLPFGSRSVLAADLNLWMRILQKFVSKDPIFGEFSHWAQQSEFGEGEKPEFRIFCRDTGKKAFTWPQMTSEMQQFNVGNAAALPTAPPASSSPSGFSFWSVLRFLRVDCVSTGLLSPSLSTLRVLEEYLFDLYGLESQYQQKEDFWKHRVGRPRDAAHAEVQTEAMKAEESEMMLQLQDATRPSSMWQHREEELAEAAVSKLPLEQMAAFVGAGAQGEEAREPVDDERMQMSNQEDMRAPPPSPALAPVSPLLPALAESDSVSLSGRGPLLRSALSSLPLFPHSVSASPVRSSAGTSVSLLTLFDDLTGSLNSATTTATSAEILDYLLEAVRLEGAMQRAVWQLTSKAASDTKDDDSPLFPSVHSIRLQSPRSESAPKDRMLHTSPRLSASLFTFHRQLVRALGSLAGSNNLNSTGSLQREVQKLVEAIVEKTIRVAEKERTKIEKETREEKEGTLETQQERWTGGEREPYTPNLAATALSSTIAAFFDRYLFLFLAGRCWPVFESFFLYFSSPVSFDLYRSLLCLHHLFQSPAAMKYQIAFATANPTLLHPLFLRSTTANRMNGKLEVPHDSKLMGCSWRCQRALARGISFYMLDGSSSLPTSLPSAPIAPELQRLLREYHETVKDHCQKSDLYAQLEFGIMGNHGKEHANQDVAGDDDDSTLWDRRRLDRAAARLLTLQRAFDDAGLTSRSLALLGRLPSHQLRQLRSTVAPQWAAGVKTELRWVENATSQQLVQAADSWAQMATRDFKATEGAPWTKGILASHDLLLGAPAPSLAFLRLFLQGARDSGIASLEAAAAAAAANQAHEAASSHGSPSPPSSFLEFLEIEEVAALLHTENHVVGSPISLLTLIKWTTGSVVSWHQTRLAAERGGGAATAAALVLPKLERFLQRLLSLWPDEPHLTVRLMCFHVYCRIKGGEPAIETAAETEVRIVEAVEILRTVCAQLLGTGRKSLRALLSPLEFSNLSGLRQWTLSHRALFHRVLIDDALVPLLLRFQFSLSSPLPPRMDGAFANALRAFTALLGEIDAHDMVAHNFRTELLRSWWVAHAKHAAAQRGKQARASKNTEQQDAESQSSNNWGSPSELPPVCAELRSLLWSFFYSNVVSSSSSPPLVLSASYVPLLLQHEDDPTNLQQAGRVVNTLWQRLKEEDNTEEKDQQQQRVQELRRLTDILLAVLAGASSSRARPVLFPLLEFGNYLSRPPPSDNIDALLRSIIAASHEQQHVHGWESTRGRMDQIVMQLYHQAKPLADSRTSLLFLQAAYYHSSVHFSLAVWADLVSGPRSEAESVHWEAMLACLRRHRAWKIAVAWLRQIFENPTNGADEPAWRTEKFLFSVLDFIRCEGGPREADEAKQIQDQALQTCTRDRDKSWTAAMSHIRSIDGALSRM
jgi:hypothetical protein